MPTWLRRFTYNEISSFYKNEKEQYEKAYGKETISENTSLNQIKSINSKMNVPDFVSKVKRPKK